MFAKTISFDIAIQPKKIISAYTLSHNPHTWIAETVCPLWESQQNCRPLPHSVKGKMVGCTPIHRLHFQV